MYYYIKGNLEFFQEGRIVVDCNGVGYDIYVSNNTLAKCCKLGEMVTIFTYMSVSQDDIRLFGFYSKQEKAMFEHLISVNGIGPKGALQVLSGMDLDSLILCIASNDTKSLSGIKGIGKKTAERIVLELGEKIGYLQNSSTISVPTNAILQQDDISDQAIMALESFGVSKTNAIKLVADARQKSDKLETVITLALRSMDN